MSGAHFIKGTTSCDGGGRLRGEFAARVGGFALGQFGGERFRELVGWDMTAFLDIKDVRRQAAELVPGDDVVRGMRNDLFRVVTREGFFGDKAEAHAMAVTVETGFVGQVMSNRL